MIGFFDSGFGGLTILKEAARLMPEYSYVYLGDNLRAPYGSKSKELIYEHTREGVEFLFEQGAELVVLACNTASAVALRKLQQEFLPEHFPDKRILGIVIPVAETAGQFSCSGKLGLMATEATVASGTYPEEIAKINPRLQIFSQACPRLVPLIERGLIAGAELENEVKNYLTGLLEQNKDIDTVILGCTHYALIKELIQKNLPTGVKAIAQGEIVAVKLKDYLARHPEIEQRIAREAGAVFLTTAPAEEVARIASLFFGTALEFKTVRI